MSAQIQQEVNKLLLIWDNGVKAEVLLKDKILVGIGRVWFGKLLLRNGSLPWRPYFATPEGM